MPFKDKEREAIYRKEYRRINDRAIKDRINVWRRKQWDLLKEYKKTLSCVDCNYSGKDHPEVLDFDHVRGDKKSSICFMKATASFKKVLEEIAKCEVVCSNCHRIRTTERYKETGYPTEKYWKDRRTTI